MSNSEGFATKQEEAKPISYIQVPECVDTWDEYFWYMASTVSIKSKDENCRVGAVIVSPNNVLLSTGFNGLPRGVYDDKTILGDKDEKLRVICHAEQNAILNAARVGIAIEGAQIYVTKFPCIACCNAIIQAGIKRIYTLDTDFWKHDPFDKDHTRKQSVLKQSRTRVDAPFHWFYKARAPITSEKKGPQSESELPQTPTKPAQGA